MHKSAQTERFLSLAGKLDPLATTGKLPSTKVRTNIDTSVTAGGTGQGESLSEDKLQRAAQLSTEKYCSVANMIDKAANLTYRLKLIPHLDRLIKKEQELLISSCSNTINFY